MNKAHTQKLYDDFPDLYSERFLSIQESLMPFGFECGDGWFNLIYELSKKINKLCPEAKASQVKEKFGGLRFYVNYCSEKGLNLIHKYEKKSYKICEDCGATKEVKLRNFGWIKTLCDGCDKKRRK